MSFETPSASSSPARKRYQKLPPSDVRLVDDDDDEDDDADRHLLRHHHQQQHPVDPSFAAVPVGDDDGQQRVVVQQHAFGGGSTAAAAGARTKSDSALESSMITAAATPDEHRGDVEGHQDMVEESAIMSLQASSPLHSGSGGGESAGGGAGVGRLGGRRGSRSSIISGGGIAGAGSRSRPTSPEMGSDWDDDDDILEDEAGLRRYHLDFPPPGSDNAGSRPTSPGGGRGSSRHKYVHASNVPLPVEFELAGGRGGAGGSAVSRLWRSFMQLRKNARQRRAARLLTMPSESFHYRLHACLLSWCCDATDRGIMLVAGLVAAWLVLGWLLSIRSPTYWWSGIGLFIIRVTARRAFEGITGCNNKARSARRNGGHRRSMIGADEENVVMGGGGSHHGVIVGGASEPYRDRRHDTSESSDDDKLRQIT